MGDESPSIDEINRLNDCLRGCADRLSACLNAWKDFADRNPKLDPNIARLGMQACSDAHFIDIQKCGIDRRHFTDDQKEGFETASLELGLIGWVGGITALGALTVFAAPLAAGVILGVSMSCVVAQFSLMALSMDPNDPNFTTVPVPSFPKLPPIRPVPNTGLTASVADAANAVIANQAQAIGLLNALVTALNRSDGAAEAGDENAEKRQLKAAHDFAKKLAKVFKDAAPLRSALASKWKGHDLNFSISKRDGLKLCDELMINGFPPPFVDVLKKLGVNRKDRNALLERMIGELGKVRKFPRFRDLLKDRKLRAAEVRLTRSFEQFSRSRRTPDKRVTAI
jgi:hypothetical protein